MYVFVCICVYVFQFFTNSAGSGSGPGSISAIAKTSNIDSLSSLRPPPANLLLVPALHRHALHLSRLRRAGTAFPDILDTICTMLPAQEE